jgi:putative DNA primase/helicase
LIPFTVQFEKDPTKVTEGKKLADTTIEAKLLAELPGILNWAIEGFREWKDKGLDPPDSVKAATQKYREESDLLGQFIAENLEQRKPGWGEPEGENATKIYKSFETWCEEHGERKTSQRCFGNAMTERGYARGKDTKTNTVCYLGLFFREQSGQSGQSGQ